MTSTISSKYPTFRDINFKTNQSWLDGKRIDDRAENLWRVHDGLYDLTAFVDKHPGGRDWLTCTKGTDITELFESHHLSASAGLILDKYKVRNAKQPRNYHFTFADNGFYRTLKRRVSEKLKTVDRSAEFRSKVITDSLFVASLALSALAVKFSSAVLIAIAGLLLTWTVISSHNFFHRKDNWRMYLFNLGGLSFKDWRISHAISHHVYTNSYHDLEISFFEPFLSWIPKKKTFLQRYGSWIYGPIMYVVLYAVEFLKRTVQRIQTGQFPITGSDLVPLVVPLTIYFTTGASLLLILRYWLTIVFVSSFCFGVIGLNAAHHHPDITHEGDSVRSQNLDWGIFQLDTVMDRADIKGSHLLSLTHFGEHAMHHLFPTIDHGLLPQFHGILLETINEFDYEMKECSWFQHLIGQNKQLARQTVNTTIRGEKQKSK